MQGLLWSASLCFVFVSVHLLFFIIHSVLFIISIIHSHILPVPCTQTQRHDSFPSHLSVFQSDLSPSTPESVSSHSLVISGFLVFSDSFLPSSCWSAHLILVLFYFYSAPCIQFLPARLYFAISDFWLWTWTLCLWPFFCLSFSTSNLWQPGYDFCLNKQRFLHLPWSASASFLRHNRGANNCGTHGFVQNNYFLMRDLIFSE